MILLYLVITKYVKYIYNKFIKVSKDSMLIKYILKYAVKCIKLYLTKFSEREQREYKNVLHLTL